MSLSFIAMQGHKYSHICNLLGKFLPVGMICTTTDTISIPMGEMYLLARMFCALAHMSFIPMGAINFYIQECFLHYWYHFYSDARTFYFHGCNVRVWNLFWARVAKWFCDSWWFYCPVHSHIFYSHGCNVFIHARMFFTLTDTIAPIFTMITEVPRANRSHVNRVVSVFIRKLNVYNVACSKLINYRAGNSNLTVN